MKPEIIILIWVLTLITGQNEVKSKQRPFYVIGHMVNCASEIETFLKEGSNALESDISFYSNGSVFAVYHGPPCDCFRNCLCQTKLSTYLNRLREITNPETENSYYKQLVYQFFDMKLSTVTSSAGKFQAGKEMADLIIDHLWVDNNHNRKPLNVLLYINTIDDINTLIGFRDRVYERNFTAFLEHVGYDGGITDSPEDIQSTFEAANIDSHVWQGYGTTNCFSAFYPDAKIKELVDIRNEPNGYIDEVYPWTIDDSNRVRSFLKLDVDGMITNVPERLISILNQFFSENYTLATIDNNPFVKYTRNQN